MLLFHNEWCCCFLLYGVVVSYCMVSLFHNEWCCCRIVFHVTLSQLGALLHGASLRLHISAVHHPIIYILSHSLPNENNHINNSTDSHTNSIFTVLLIIKSHFYSIWFGSFLLKINLIHKFPSAPLNHYPSSRTSYKLNFLLFSNQFQLLFFFQKFYFFLSFLKN